MCIFWCMNVCQCIPSKERTDISTYMLSMNLKVQQLGVWSDQTCVIHVCKFTHGNMLIVCMCISVCIHVTRLIILYTHVAHICQVWWHICTWTSTIDHTCQVLTAQALPTRYQKCPIYKTGIQSCCSLLPLPRVPLIVCYPSSDSPLLSLCREELSQFGMRGKRGEAGENWSEFAWTKCKEMYYLFSYHPCPMYLPMHMSM